MSLVVIFVGPLPSFEIPGCLDQFAITTGKPMKILIEKLRKEIESKKEIIFVKNTSDFHALVSLSRDLGCRTLLIYPFEIESPELLLWAFHQEQRISSKALTCVFDTHWKQAPTPMFDAMFVEAFHYLKDDATLPTEIKQKINDHLRFNRGKGFRGTALPDNLLEDYVGERMFLSEQEIIQKIEKLASHYSQCSPGKEFRKDREPAYIAVNLDEGSKKQLRALALEKVSPDEQIKEYASHITLMHINSLKDQQTLQLWQAVKDCIGQKVEVKVTEVHFDEKSSVVFRVDVGDIHVQSGVPHITGILPKNMLPVVSISLLNEKTLPKVEMFHDLIVHGTVSGSR